jgi:hypothetical protein
VPYHLLTVDHAHAVGGDVQVAPTVRLQRLEADSPGEMKPMRGDAVELRLPDGQIRRAAIRLFGIDGWQKDGYFYTASNPAGPELTLSIQDAEPADIPAGTQVWLPDRDPGSSPENGPCSYCQMIQATDDGPV